MKKRIIVAIVTKVNRYAVLFSAIKIPMHSIITANIAIVGFSIILPPTLKGLKQPPLQP